MEAELPVHITSVKFENAGLFLRLGLPFTIIRHENGTFRKCSSNQGNLFLLLELPLRKRSFSKTLLKPGAHCLCVPRKRHIMLLALLSISGIM